MNNKMVWPWSRKEQPKNELTEITVNGKTVYSNRKVKTIAGSKIIFEGGSWYDVDTESMVVQDDTIISTSKFNVGKGGGEKKTFGPIKYKANAVSLTNIIDCDANIEVWDDPETEVTIVGPEKVVNNINVSKQGNILCVSSKNLKRNNIVVNSNRNSVVLRGLNFGNIISGSYNGNSNCVVNGNGSSIVYGNHKNEGKITIKVPKATGVLIDNVEGDCVVGDTEGKIEVLSEGSSGTIIGKVTEANLCTEGSGKISVDRINGKAELIIEGSGGISVNEINGPSLSIQNEGSGKTNIRNGKVDFLEAVCEGSGNISFGGTATNADLTSEGSGSIRINRVIKDLTKNKDGSGSIVVSERG